MQAIIMLITSVLILIRAGSGVSAKDIKIGAIINLTGPASSWGQFYAKRLQDYFRYVNDIKGGIYGNNIKLTVVDSAYKVPNRPDFNSTLSSPVFRCYKYIKCFASRQAVKNIARDGRRHSPSF